MNSKLVHGTVAAALGVVLLAGSGGTLAGWTDKSPIGQGTLVTGSMAVTSTAPAYTLTRADLVAGATSMTDVATTTTSINPATTLLVPGDVVTLTTTVTVTLQGANAKGNLTLNPTAITGETNLATELNSTGAVSLTPVGAAPAATSNGTNSWALTSASNGAQYQLRVKLTVRGTKDGAAPNPSTVPTGASTGNWWGTTLQGAAANGRTLPITLTQTL